jgi:hypothetical protein
VSYNQTPQNCTQPQIAARDRVCVARLCECVETDIAFPSVLQLYTVYSSATSTPHDRELWQTKAQSVMDSPPRARVSVRVPPHLVVRVASEKANKRLLGRSGVWALRARSKLPGAILKIAMLA